MSDGDGRISDHSRFQQFVANGALPPQRNRVGSFQEIFDGVFFHVPVPFGPQAGEYLAWYTFGGGKQLFEELYHEHNIHGIICGVIAPEASGWFREPVIQSCATRSTWAKP